MPKLAINPWHMRQVRHKRNRGNMPVSSDRPRLCVFRSLRHIYAQVIDDSAGRTLVSASTAESDVRERLSKAKKTDAAKLIGQIVAERSKEKGVTKVVFDRGGYKYHGRVKALADAAREGGLQF